MSVEGVDPPAAIIGDHVGPGAILDRCQMASVSLGARDKALGDLQRTGIDLLRGQTALAFRRW
jgi:hypothetical protein